MLNFPLRVESPTLALLAANCPSLKVLRIRAEVNLLELDLCPRGGFFPKLHTLDSIDCDTQRGLQSKEAQLCTNPPKVLEQLEDLIARQMPRLSRFETPALLATRYLDTANEEWLWYEVVATWDCETQQPEDRRKLQLQRKLYHKGSIKSFDPKCTQQDHNMRY